MTLFLNMMDLLTGYVYIFWGGAALMSQSQLHYITEHTQLQLDRMLLCP